MKISAEITQEKVGTWEGYYAKAVFINDKRLGERSPLRLLGAGSTPEEAIEYLAKQFTNLGRALVEFEVEDNPKVNESDI